MLGESRARLIATLDCMLGRQLPRVGHGGSSVLEVYRILDQAIRQGLFAQGSRLPSERRLAHEIGVSRATLRHALVSLADGGLLEASPNRGWFVTQSAFTEGANLLRSFTEVAAERGFAASARVVRRATRPATLDEADALGLVPAAPVFEIERLRLMEQVPICVDYSCMPLARVSRLAEMPLEDGSLFRALEDVCGIVPARSDYELQADSADGRIGGLLGIPAGAPVLVGYERTYDQNGVMFRIGRATFRGDAYRFKATLVRG